MYFAQPVGRVEVREASFRLSALMAEPVVGQKLAGLRFEMGALSLLLSTQGRIQSLGDRVKTGQTRSPQNRPTDGEAGLERSLLVTGVG
jgi:hypothetical protein